MPCWAGVQPPGVWGGWIWTSAPSTPEADGAFCLEVAGLCRFLGAVEKLPYGSRVSGGSVICILMKAVLVVGTSQRSVLQAS